LSGLDHARANVTAEAVVARLNRFRPVIQEEAAMTGKKDIGPVAGKSTGLGLRGQL
jgi:hypothetical protein